MSFDQITKVYGPLIWKVACNYYVGMWKPVDVYSEIVLKIFVAMKDGKLGTGAGPETQRIVKSFIISKAIDIVRKELYRQSKSQIHLDQHHGDDYDFIQNFEDEHIDEIIDDAPTTYDEVERKSEEERIYHLLLERLPLRDALFIHEMMYPSDRTVNIAMAEQRKKLCEGGLKMNINFMKITTMHVSQAFEEQFGVKISKATVCRIRQNAAEKLADVLGGKVDCYA